MSRGSNDVRATRRQTSSDRRNVAFVNVRAVTAAGAAGSVPTLAIAELNAVVVSQRSAGSFWSAAWMARSRAAGTVLRRDAIDPGRSVKTLATIACVVGPVNGGSPSNISYATQPRA